MCSKNNIFIAAAILIIVSAFCPCAAAQTDVSFDIPAPPNTRLLDTSELNLGELQIYVTTYESDEAAGAVIYYYRNFFTQEGFQKISDAANAKRKRQTMRFKKDQLIVDVIVTDKRVKTEIAVSKFLQAAEETSAQAAGRLTADNLISNLPDEDEPGEDLANLPRPPQSVRMTRQDSGSGATIIYRTPLDVVAVADFYRLQMSGGQWGPANEIPIQRAIEAYKQASGKTTLGIKSPFPDGEDFQQVISDSYMLQFSSDSANAQVTIFPNFLSRESGSMVQIVYQEKE